MKAASTSPSSLAATGVQAAAHDPAATPNTLAPAAAHPGSHAGAPLAEARIASPTPTAPGLSDRDPFAAIDGNPAMAPTWLHAGSRHAEAGFEDPALGWVGVRADLSGGGIHASLVPGSSDAAEALGTHLAGLNAFLAERHGTVETVTLALPEMQHAAQHQPAGSGAQPDSRQQGGGESGGPDHRQDRDMPRAAPGVQGAVAASIKGHGPGQASGVTAVSSSSGTHVSVMA